MMEKSDNHINTEMSSPHTTVFGPDSARYIIAIGAPVLATTLSVILAIESVWFSGVATLLFMFSVWYGINSITDSSVVLTKTGLHVTVPLRSFNASWSSISDVRHGRAFFNIYSVRGDHYKVPLYTENPLTALAVKHLHLFKSHKALETSLESHKESYSSDPDSEYEFANSWVFPSRHCILLALVGAIVVQLAVVVVAG
jgi:hypothetical protein